jgi:iron complex transport system substrate-binding protein
MKLLPHTTARSAAAAIAGALVAVLALGGCSVKTAAPSPAPTASGPLVPLADLDLAANPRTHVGESTALLRTTAITPVTTSPTQTLPVTVASHDPGGDTPVTVTDASRILGLDLAGSIAATITGLGLGDRLVGRDISTTFPPASDLPLVTKGGHTINAEAVLSLRPSVIVTDGTIGPIDVLLQLRDAGIAVVFVTPEPGISGIAGLARDVAAALGAPEAGELLATSLDDAVQQKIAEIAAIAPKEPADRVRMLFLYLRGNSGIYYLFGEESGADELITALGGVDVAGEIGWEGMRPMTDEAMISADPDLILVMTDGLASAGGVDGLLAAKPAIALTTAGQNRRFVDMADGEILGFGPRTPEVLDALARAIYAPGD